MRLKKEEKKDNGQDDLTCPQEAEASRKEPISFVKAFLRECLCQTPLTLFTEKFISQDVQFITLQGIQFIWLGAVVDELTPQERVNDTLEQLTAHIRRIISIGYFDDEDRSISADYDGEQMSLQKVLLDVWIQHYPDDKTMSQPVKKSIENITSKKFDAAISDFSQDLQRQKARPHLGYNLLLSGITAHNLGVLYAIQRRGDEAMEMFQQSINLKRAAFGKYHAESADSFDELGIQYFAQANFEHALEAFTTADAIRQKCQESFPPLKIASGLNNMACCYFLMKDLPKAVETLQNALDVIKRVGGSSATSELDLLHVAISLGNFGYLQLCQKKYDEASSIFEEVLLIQQSVLQDGHLAIQDTLSNLQSTNAFHS